VSFELPQHALVVAGIARRKIWVGADCEPRRDSLRSSRLVQIRL